MLNAGMKCGFILVKFKPPGQTRCLSEDEQVVQITSAVEGEKSSYDRTMHKQTIIHLLASWVEFNTL